MMVKRNNIGYWTATVLTMALAIPGCGQAHDDHHDDHDGHEHEGHDHSEDAHSEHGDEEEHADEVTLTPQAIERWKILVEPATKKTLEPLLHAPGRVGFNQEHIAHVGSIVSGRVQDIRVRIGDRVSKGDPLLVVASPELGQAQSDYLQKLTNVATAGSSQDVAKSLYLSAKSLYDQTKGIALAEVQRREAELKAAQGTLLAAEGAATAAENTLHLLGMDQDAVDALAKHVEVDPNFVVRAPIGGEVIDREATLGESVGPERDALLVLADMTHLWVLVDVPESSVGSVKHGTPAVIRIPSLGDQQVSGTVSYLSPRLNTATRTIAARIEVAGGEASLLPGMFVEVELRLPALQTQAVLAVPEEAVQLVEGDTSVFVPVEGEPNTFVRRVVVLGESVGGMVPVIEGLVEGEMYVAKGSFILKADLGKAGAAHEH